MILDFQVNNNFLENNLIEFANTIRVLLFEEDESIYELIDIDNDAIFLDPSLFSYFSNKHLGLNTPPLLQLLWGYIDTGKRPECIDVVADSGGVIILPNYGHFVCYPGERCKLFWDKDQETPCLKIRNSIADAKFLQPMYLENSTIQLAINHPEFLFLNDGADILEPVLDTTNKFISTINSAWEKMVISANDFTSLLEKTNRQVLMFNSLTQYSKASYAHYGTAFINVFNKVPTEAFFIDDLAHQCGHVLFYALSLPSDIFLKHKSQTPLKQFINIDWETRDIYGCFHGLFTYSTIVHCLDRYIELIQYSIDNKREAIGRLCFYMDKFKRDLVHMHNGQILTSKGFDYFDMFQSGYTRMLDKYKHFIRNSDFTNQSYLFDYKAYKLLNETKLFS